MAELPTASHSLHKCASTRLMNVLYRSPEILSGNDFIGQLTELRNSARQS